MKNKYNQNNPEYLKHFKYSEEVEKQEYYKRYFDNIKEINKKLKMINILYFDVVEFTQSLKRLIEGLYFFNETIVPQETGNPSTSKYTIRGLNPIEGQMVFVDLSYGYPKETQDFHWCYLLKAFGCKVLVIPSTSVKDSSKPNPNFEIDIEVKNFLNAKTTRLHIDEMRSIDIQRISTLVKPRYYDVVTSRDKILNEVTRIMFLDTCYNNLICKNFVLNS